MNLFLDMQGAQTRGSRGRGIGRYSRDLARALAAHPAFAEIRLAWNGALDSPVGEIGLPPPKARQPRLVSQPYGVLPRDAFTGHIHDIHQDINDSLLRHAIARSRCEHVLFSSIMETDELDFVLPKNLNFHPLATSYAIVYDLIPLLFKEHYLPHESFERKYQAHLHVKTTADILFAISERTRADLIAQLDIDPDRVVTIGAGIDLNTFHRGRDAHRRFSDRHGLQRPFLFFVGGDEFRKNLGGLVRAMGHLGAARRKGLQLLVVGPVADDKADDLRRRAAQMRLPEDALVFASHLSHDDMRQAYRDCAMTVIPSFYEGFGLPVLEAMACGSAVIASGNSSMSEVLTEQDFLFDANNPRDIAGRINFVLDHPEGVEAFRRTYSTVLERCSWKAVADRVVATFTAATERRRAEATTRSPRPRQERRDIVVLGPAPETWTEAICRIGRTHNVRVYAASDAIDNLNDLPLTIDRLDNFIRTGSEIAPTITFIAGLEALVELLRDFTLADHLLVFTPATTSALRRFLTTPPQRKLTKNERALKRHAGKLRTAGALWIDTGRILQPLAADNLFDPNAHHEPAHTTRIDEARTPAQLALWLETEMRRIAETDPSTLAVRLRAVVHKANRKGIGAGRLAALAAISIFDAGPVDAEPVKTGRGQ